MRSASLPQFIQKALQHYLYSKDPASAFYRKPAKHGYSGHLIQVSETIQYQLSLDPVTFVNLFDPVSDDHSMTINQWSAFYAQLVSTTFAK